MKTGVIKLLLMVVKYETVLDSSNLSLTKQGKVKGQAYKLPAIYRYRKANIDINFKHVLHNSKT